MQEPFIMLPRSFFTTGYWRQSRTYNDCEAVLDIIFQVRFEASETCSRIGGRMVTWKQYQWPASVRFLATRWKWSEKKVRVFMATLRRQGVITTDDSQGVNIITLQDSPFFHTNQVEGTVKGTPMDFILSELRALRAQQGAQPDNQGHSKGTKHKKEKENNDSSLCSESLLFDIPEEYPFEDFWNLYDKKVSKAKTSALYAKLSLSDRKAIFEFVPKYLLAQPDKQFRKDPTTFLRNRSWEDELITRNRYGTTQESQGNGASSSPSDQQLVADTYNLINEARARENLDDNL